MEWKAKLPRRKIVESRLPGAERRKKLIEAAMPLAESYGFEHVTRDMVASAAKCSNALLTRHWTARDFQTALVQAALQTRNLRVIAQALAARHPLALSADTALKREALNSLMGE